jgi:hypothetical protein
MKKKKKLAIAFAVLALILGGATVLCWFAVSRGYWWIALLIVGMLLWSGISGYRRARKGGKEKATPP